MDRVDFTVPGTPLAWARARVLAKDGKPRFFTPPARLQYMNHVVMCAQTSLDWPSEPWDGPVYLEVRAVFPRPKRLMRRKDPDGEVWCVRKPDLDNLMKIVCDALTRAGLWRDDAQVAMVVVRKVWASKVAAPRLEVHAERMRAS